MSDEEDDLYDELIEKNRMKIVKYIDPEDFFDSFREQSVLNIDDTDVIQSIPARRKKAGKFLDILQTKGNRGVIKFIDLLEFQYPDLYELIKKEKPRPPPPNFKRTSRGMSLKMLNRLPELAQRVCQEYKQNKELQRDLEVMANGLKLEQNDIIELERENDELRRKIDSSDKELKRIREKVAFQAKEVDRLHNELATSLKDSLKYKNEKDMFEEKCRELQHQKDKLQKMLIAMNSDDDGLPDSLISNSRPCDFRDSTSENNISHQSDLEKQILQDKLNESDQQREDLGQRLYAATEEINTLHESNLKYKRQYEKLHQECERLRNELTNRDERIQKYFDDISSLMEEKKQLTHEKILAQQQAGKVTEDWSKLFKEHHQLQQSYDKLKLDFRLSQGSSTGSENDDCLPSAHKLPYRQKDAIGQSHSHHYVTVIKNPCSPKDHSKTLEFFPHKKPLERTSTVQAVYTDDENRSVEEHDPDAWRQRVFSSSIGKIISDNYIREENLIKRRSEILSGQWIEKVEGNIDDPVDMLSERSDDSFHNHENLCSHTWQVCDEMIPDVFERLNSVHPTVTVKLQTKFINKLVFFGGNIVGIYIQSIVKKLDLPIQEGDRLLSIGTFISDSLAVHTDLGHRTYVEAMNIITGQGNPENVNIIELRLARDPEGFHLAKKWSEEHRSTGDFLFVKAAFNFENVASNVSVKSGDIFCVVSTNTKSTKQQLWKAFQYKNSQNTWDDNLVNIPSNTYARRHQMDQGRCNRSRQKAFRHRTYQRLLPMRECEGTTGPVKRNLPTSPDPFCPPVTWINEKHLDPDTIDQYRHILGFGPDTSFSATFDSSENSGVYGRANSSDIPGDSTTSA